jgi:hypothetical protein
MRTVMTLINMVISIWVLFLLLDYTKIRLRQRKTKKIIRTVDEAMSKWLSEHYPSQPAQKYIPPFQAQAPVRRWNDLDPPPDPGLPEKTVKQK